MTRLKRMTIEWAPEKKVHRFITAPRSGHKMTESLPLLMVVRDVLELAENARESRKIIKGRLVKVDGGIVTDIKRGVGAFDVIEIGGKHYRVLPKKKIELVNAKHPDTKVVKIVRKKKIRGGKIQLNMSDGRNILIEDSKHEVLDSLVIELPSQKIKQHIPLEPGTTVFITHGQHRGKTAKLEIIERDKNRVWISSGGKRFEAPLHAVTAIGKEQLE